MSCVQWTVSLSVMDGGYLNKGRQGPNTKWKLSLSNSNSFLSSWLHHSDTMQFLTTFSWRTFMAPPLPVRVQAITLKCWTNTTDPTTWIKHTNIVSFVLFLNNSGYWMLFVFNEIESNNYRLNEIWPTKLCIKNVIETGPYLRCQILLGIVRNGRSRKFVTKDLTHFPISTHALQIQISTIF